MCKRFILLLGVVLGSYVPMSAQTLRLQTIPAQDRTVMSMTVIPTAPAPLFAPSLEGLKGLSSMREVKTLFLTQSMLPLLQLWGGRLRLDGFTSTLHMQNVQLGPSAAGGLLDYRPPRQNYPGGALSVHLSGISLSFHFGRDAQIGRPGQIWQRIARIHAAVR